MCVIVGKLGQCGGTIQKKTWGGMADPSNRQSFLLKCQKKDGPVNFGEEKRGNRDTVF